MDHPTPIHKESDLESSTFYSPLILNDDLHNRHRLLNTRILALAIASLFLLCLGSFLSRTDRELSTSPLPPVRRRGLEAGVSDKSSPVVREEHEKPFAWTDDMLQWQRTAFHFQPEKNWMNDPNGPLYYKGWYHLFYQYNPGAPVWGNITWGHAASRDLVNWRHLAIALMPGDRYDYNGVWTGSATLLPNGKIVMIYTGSTDGFVQVQNIAYPADHSDPLLVNWVKSELNPVLLPPPGVDPRDFRDPTTAWYIPSDSSWRFVIGSKDDSEHTGIALVYRTEDFTTFNLLPGVLHQVKGTGMWECVDFYPVATDRDEGLDTSVLEGKGVKHVLKASFDDDRHDYYAIGTYDVDKGKWKLDREDRELGLGLRYDYGRFYASKTFYDVDKKRRVLWGWIPEADSEESDYKKGWASLQAIPRTVRFDEKTKENLLLWPVEELESLRFDAKVTPGIHMPPGIVVPLSVDKATQLDIMVEFDLPPEVLEAVAESEENYTCGKGGGAAARGAAGPFGLLVLADGSMTEMTAVYFYVARGSGGNVTTFVCHDELRSSRAGDVFKGVHGSTVPVLKGEKLSLRTLVDHSIVETFAQGGRVCVTSRVYPTIAIRSEARLFLFNNATRANVTATMVKTWEMKEAGTSSAYGRNPMLSIWATLMILIYILSN